MKRDIVRHEDSMYLQGGMRDPLLRELLGLLGLDFWALDEVQKEDLARAVSEHIKPHSAKLLEEQSLEHEDGREELVERFASAAKLENPDDLASDDAIRKIADKVFDLSSDRDAWKEAYWGLRSRLYASLGVEDEHADRLDTPEDAQVTETAVEEVAALREMARKDARKADKAETAAEIPVRGVIL